MDHHQDQLQVVLVAPRNPLNIGAAARAMSNFGFLHLRVVNPYEVAYAEARSAVKATAVLAQSQQYATAAEAVADCELVVGTATLDGRSLEHPVRRLETAGRLIRSELASGGRVALMFGSEKFGLSKEDLSLCHWMTRIPTREEHGSMNLGQAVAVCLYELIRSEAAESHEPRTVRPAPAGEVQRITDLAVEALKISGYIQEKTSESSELKLRRMLMRSAIPKEDSAAWLGMFRQILWKLKQER